MLSFEVSSVKTPSTTTRKIIPESEIKFQPITLFCAIDDDIQNQSQSQSQNQNQQQMTTTTTTTSIQKGLCIEYRAVIEIQQQKREQNSEEDDERVETIFPSWDLTNCVPFMRRPVTVLADWEFDDDMKQQEQEQKKKEKQTAIAVPGYVEASKPTSSTSFATTTAAASSQQQQQQQQSMRWIGKLSVPSKYQMKSSVMIRLLVASHFTWNKSKTQNIFSAICPLPFKTNNNTQKRIGDVIAKIKAVAKNPNGREFEVKHSCLVSRASNDPDNNSNAENKQQQQPQQSFRFVESLDVNYEQQNRVELLLTKDHSSSVTNDEEQQHEQLELAVEMELTSSKNSSFLDSFMRKGITDSNNPIFKAGLSIGNVISSPAFLIGSIIVMFIAAVISALLKSTQ